MKDEKTPVESPELYKTGLEQRNRAKNRYQSVVALDATRVRLTPDEYINANYVDVGDKNFLVSQSPLSCTVEDFWKMVHEKRVGLIGMFTGFEERGMKKAEKYWPDIGEVFKLKIGKLKGIKSWEEGEFEISEFDLVGEKVEHWRYLAWPDFGVPESFEVLRFIARAKRNENVLVHCSAGCGRSGVVCAIYRRFKTREDLPLIVESIRKCRQGMVKTESQYDFIYRMTFVPKGMIVGPLREKGEKVRELYSPGLHGDFISGNPTIISTCVEISEGDGIPAEVCALIEDPLDFYSEYECRIYFSWKYQADYLRKVGAPRVEKVVWTGSKWDL